MTDKLLQFTINKQLAAVRAEEVRYVRAFGDEENKYDSKTVIECYDMKGNTRNIYSTDEPADVIKAWRLALSKETPSNENGWLAVITKQVTVNDLSNSLFIVREALIEFGRGVAFGDASSELMRLLQAAGFIRYDDRSKIWHVTESGARISSLSAEKLV